MNRRFAKFLGLSLVLCLVIGLMFTAVGKVDAYYGSYYGSGLYGTSSLYGGLYGSSLYGGLYGSSLYGGLYGSSLYGGLYGSSLYGGLYGGYGLYGSSLYGMYGGLMGMYGGLMGMYGGLMGMYGGLSSLYSPFSISNLFYPVETTSGLSYQVPFTQIAPLLGVAGLYNQLFPNLFNPIPTTTTTGLSTTPVI